MKKVFYLIRQGAYTLFSFCYFLGLALDMTVRGFLIITLRGATDEHKQRYHQILQRKSRFVIHHVPGSTFSFSNPTGEDFDRPSVIISNHQSHLDLMAIMMLTPNLIILTKNWVWNNPFYGLVIRYADFFPVSETEKMVQDIASMVAKGYSVMIFPEGTRSEDCHIQRFHRGAFYLAERLHLDIVPVFIDGFGKVLPKRAMRLYPGYDDGGYATYSSRKHSTRLRLSRDDPTNAPFIHRKESMKRCVIIGSGLGGLSCGVILSKNGYEVTVLEQGQQIGGCLQCFHRGKATFDTGMHYIGSADKGQTLHTILRYLDIDKKIELSRLDPLKYDIISYKGEHYHFANGRENFVNVLAEQFSQSREELDRYYNLVKLVSSSSAMHSLNRNVDIDVNTEYKMRSVNEVIDEIISDSTLQQVLVGIQPLYAGVKDRTPFSTHALIHDCFEQSAFRIVGGSSSVAKSLAILIEKSGGKVLTQQQVSEIECNSTKATAVNTITGERYAADLIISAIHPSKTLQLVSSPLIRPIYRKRINSYQNTSSVFVVYLKFRKDSIRYMNHNLYFYRSDSTWGCDNYDITSWPKFLLYMHFCHKNNPEYAETGKILTYMNFDEVRQWLGTHVGKRGESYENFKRNKAELILDALEEEIPDIRYHIESYYTSTPLTYLDYTGIPEGAMYGIAKDVNAIGLNSISCKTSVPNLLLTGQNITSHGMFGVLAGSLITCSEVLTSDEISHN